MVNTQPQSQDTISQVMPINNKPTTPYSRYELCKKKGRNARRILNGSLCDHRQHRTRLTYLNENILGCIGYVHQKSDKNIKYLVDNFDGARKNERNVFQERRRFGQIVKMDALIALK